MEGLRRKTRVVRVGNLHMGGQAPVSVQSMLNTSAHNSAASLAQALALQAAGCDLVRVAVPDAAAVPVLAALKAELRVPLCADIHFDYRLALESVAAGADKIRMNPGNIGDLTRVQAVASACARANVPIRVGVNSGSLERDLLEKYGAPTPQAMAQSALRAAAQLEACGFGAIVLSLKSSSVAHTVAACEALAAQCDYPLHIGVTEAGTARMGRLKSAAGLGALLLRGIGDTLRVSLTADPLEEVRAGVELLQAVGLRKGLNLIACPSCGRCKINLIALAERVETALQNCPKAITVAVMGCAVNGPGEAREADIGLAGGDGCVLLFKKEKILGKFSEDQALPALLQHIEAMP